MVLREERAQTTVEVPLFYAFTSAQEVANVVGAAASVERVFFTLSGTVVDASVSPRIQEASLSFPGSVARTPFPCDPRLRVLLLLQSVSLRDWGCSTWPALSAGDADFEVLVFDHFLEHLGLMVVLASTTLCGRPLLPAHRDLGPHRAGVHSGGSAVRPWTLAPSTRTAGSTFSLVRRVRLRLDTFWDV